ncbi:hypothetical protein HOY82DRAFT_669077 [Tuber indicum]|nr:hypothetical protein HOY82DRAFT_669077 [Tuber indicum]
MHPRSRTATAVPSSSHPLTLCIKGVNNSNFVDFFKEHNISLPADYPWPAFIAFVFNYIPQEAEAEVIHTTTDRLQNGGMDFSITLSNAAACYHVFHILSQSKAFRGCDIQCRGD